MQPALDPRKYKAEKWTTVLGVNTPEHEVWAVLDIDGNPVAFGTENTMREYADEVNHAECS